MTEELTARGPQPAEFDGEWLIRRIHRIGESNGYERVRVDRGAVDAQTYYEVGYGPIYTVTMKTSSGEIYQVTDRTWDSFDSRVVRDMLQRNKGESS